MSLRLELRERGSERACRMVSQQASPQGHHTLSPHEDITEALGPWCKWSPPQFIPGGDGLMRPSSWVGLEEGRGEGRTEAWGMGSSGHFAVSPVDAAGVCGLSGSWGRGQDWGNSGRKFPSNHVCLCSHHSYRGEVTLKVYGQVGAPGGLGLRVEGQVTTERGSFPEFDHSKDRAPDCAVVTPVWALRSPPSRVEVTAQARRSGYVGGRGSPDKRGIDHLGSPGGPHGGGDVELGP